jgi:glycosyltransferase involved in cell wall biosynthesis
LLDFVFLGRLVSDKGADMAIDAIAALKRDGYLKHLTIIGDGEDKNMLVERVKAQGLNEQVNFTGSLNGKELMEKISEHKYMLIPSRWKEPFGVVALEGLACGCVPIVSDGGGLPDAIGEAGLVFKRGDLDDLVCKMKLVIEDSELVAKLKDAAVAQVASHEASLIADKYLEIFKKACKSFK